MIIPIILLHIPPLVYGKYVMLSVACRRAGVGALPCPRDYLLLECVVSGRTPVPAMPLYHSNQRWVAVGATVA